MMPKFEWRGRTDFAELAEAIGCTTGDIMACTATRDPITGVQQVMVLWTTNTQDDPVLWRSLCTRDRDQILVAGPAEGYPGGWDEFKKRIELSDA